MIFVSYARVDAAAALALADALRARGLACLIDPPLVQGDAFWRDKVARWLAACDVMLVVDSPHADASPWVCQERRAFGGAHVHADATQVLQQGCEGVVQQVQAACGASGATSPGSPPGDALAALQAPAADPAAREALRHRSEQTLAAFLSTLPAAARAECAGDRAWLRSGRTELRRVSATASDYLAVEPVTNALYREFLQATGFAAPPPTWLRPAFAADDQPVTGITWYEAAACAAWCGGELPTESARALAAALDPHDGCREPLPSGLAVFASDAPRALVQLPADAAGFRGLCGHTWDWCATPTGTHRVIRGGSWMDCDDFRTAGARYRNAPTDADCSVGLRIAWRAAPVPQPTRRP